MTQQVTLSQIKPIFIQVARANGYEKDLSPEVPREDGIVPEQSQDKGFIVYETEFATIFDRGNVPACVLQLSDQGIDIVSTKRSGEFAQQLAGAIDKEYSETIINLMIGQLCDCSSGEKC